ncbi:MAG: hypothetical protein A2Y73_03690 [Chloroflexi bacterium RBG_13_56_8]|nr:MAG: hypothetical protein A2Y73_03690 [Chloroflexi bacterium RBG_13_56_8]
MLQLGVLRLVAIILGLLIAITVHEAAHAWAANQLGDPTARYLRRISLNPLVHLDPLGTAMMAVTAITGMGIGWGKPVPVSVQRLRYGPRRGNALVALAGPTANLLAAAILGLGLRLGRALPASLLLMLGSIVYTSIVIAIFNLLPLPPLDGHSVLLGLLSLSQSRWAWQASQFIISLQRQGPMLLILLIIVPQFLGINILGWLIGPPTLFLYNALAGLGA